MKTKQIVTARLILTSALLVVLATSGIVAHAANVNDLFKYLPADGHVALGLPNIEEVENAGGPLLALPQLAMLGQAAVALGGDTLAEGLANAGINAQAPGAVFLNIASPSNLAFSGVLMVKDADKVKETLVSLIGSEGAAVELPGDIEGRFAAGAGAGYFLNDGLLFVASTEAMLRQLAERIGAPADVNYGAAGPKDEVVVWSRIDIIEQNNLLALAAPLANVKPILDTIKPFSDEVLFAIGEQAGKAYLRVAARDNGAGISSPGSLSLHSFMDAQAPVLLNLRLTPELLNAVSIALMANESTRQAGGLMRIGGQMLGDELAISFKGMKGDKVPDAVIATTVKQAATVPNLLRMLAKIEAPSYQHEGKDVYVYPNVAPGTDLHIAIEGETLVITPGGDELKAALEMVAKAADGGGVNNAIVNRGVYGFLALDGAKAADLNLPIPGNIDLSKINLALTLGIDGDWREAVMTSPAGFAGIADMLKGVL